MVVPPAEVSVAPSVVVAIPMDVAVGVVRVGADWVVKDPSLVYVVPYAFVAYPA